MYILFRSGSWTVRGQKIGAYVTLASYYFIGIRTAILLGFVFFFLLGVRVRDWTGGKETLRDHKV